MLNQSDSYRRTSQDAEQHTERREASECRERLWMCVSCWSARCGECGAEGGEEPPGKYLIKYRSFFKYETIDVQTTFRHSPMARISACHAGIRVRFPVLEFSFAPCSTSPSLLRSFLQNKNLAFRHPHHLLAPSNACALPSGAAIASKHAAFWSLSASHIQTSARSPSVLSASDRLDAWSHQWTHSESAMW